MLRSVVAYDMIAAICKDKKQCGGRIIGLGIASYGVCKASRIGNLEWWKAEGVGC